MNQDTFIAATEDDPTDLDLRLDFADWLQRKGNPERAAWIRWSCRFGETQFPLDRQQPLWATRSSKDFPYAFSGNASVLKLLRPQLWDFFAHSRPEYWNKIPGVRQDPYFGRIIFTVMSRPNRDMNKFDWVAPTRSLGRARWLADAARDGWLEGVDLPLYDVTQVRALLEWPDDQTSIPLFLSTADARADGFDNELMRHILSLPGLRGLQMSREESTFRCMKLFAAQAADVQHVSLLNLTKAKASIQLLEQLGDLRRIRTLHLVGYTPKELMAPLASHPTLRTLILFSANLTDEDLRVFETTRALRVLLIADGLVSRRGVRALQEANPRLKIVLGDDLRWGPV